MMVASSTNYWMIIMQSGKGNLTLCRHALLQLHSFILAARKTLPCCSKPTYRPERLAEYDCGPRWRCHQVSRSLLHRQLLLGGSGKTKSQFIHSFSVCVILLFSAEFAYERFIQEQWNDPSAERLKEARQHDEDQWMSMSPREKSLKWARDHRYQIVFGS